MNDNLVIIDVREDLRSGREPLGRILKSVASLPAGHGLRIIASFKPSPLLALLGSKGFTHRATALEGGLWQIDFLLGDITALEGAVPEKTSGRSSSSKAGLAASVPASFIEVDARGLEPPQPLVTILENLAALPDGAQLRARTDRRPLHLYPQLEARGFRGITEETSDGSYITVISPCN